MKNSDDSVYIDEYGYIHTSVDGCLVTVEVKELYRKDAWFALPDNIKYDKTKHDGGMADDGR